MNSETGRIKSESICNSVKFGVMHSMKLIIITGMPGAGKSEIANAFSDVDVPIVVMGDVVREEAKKRGLDPNPDNTKRIMLELREKDGMGAIAKRCIKKILEIGSDSIVIEGCRSIDELDVFDDYADEVVIVGVHSSPETRFKRLKDRGRPDAPIDKTQFRERDLRELSVGLGNVIALSSLMIVNEGSLEELQREAKRIVERVL